MFLIRDVFHCKPGNVRPLVEKFKELAKALKKMKVKNPLRLYTDFSGERYWTLVAEQEVESLEAYADMMKKSMSDKALQKVMTGYHDFILDGHREIYKVE